MFKVIFYKTETGREPAKEFIDSVRLRKGKDAEINIEKNDFYIEILSNFGLSSGLPYIKHLIDEIWELRPLKNRIFFGVWHNGLFVLLHGFTKKTRRTPKAELEKALREYEDFKRRNS